MSLLNQVRRVAKEFEYPPEEVNKGVKEFIRQMGEAQWVSATSEQEMLNLDVSQMRACKRQVRT